MSRGLPCGFPPSNRNVNSTFLRNLLFRSIFQLHAMQWGNEKGLIQQYSGKFHTGKIKTQTNKKQTKKHDTQHSFTY
jgi:hypothetical protein